MVYLSESAIKHIKDRGFSDVVIDVIKFTS